MLRRLTWVLGAAYVLLLTVGALALRGRPRETSSGYSEARADLRPNQQIARGDLAEPDRWSARDGLPASDPPPGMYSLGAKGTGEHITPRELASLPDLRRAPGEMLFVHSFTNDAVLVHLLRPDMRVTPCYTQPATTSSPARRTCLRSPLPVVAVHRPSNDKDVSWVALGVTRTQARKLGQFVAATTKYLLVMNDSAAGSSQHH